MPQLIRPATIRVVPRDGEIEINLNICISIDGNGIVEKTSIENQQEDKVEMVIPDFLSGVKLDSFGK